MHQSLQIVTASTCEPLTRSEAKDWLRVSVDVIEDDFIIDALLTASRKKIEAECQRFFYQTSCALHLDEFPSESTGVLKLPVSPLVSVTSIASYDSTDGETVMSSSDYTVDTYSEPGRIALRGSGTWPSPTRTVNGGKVLFTAGYSSSTQDGPVGLPTDCAPMLSATKLLLAHLYENRQQVVVQAGTVVSVELPYGVSYLLSGLMSPEVEG